MESAQEIRDNIKNISGEWIENNKTRPLEFGLYYVGYSDSTFGIEHFNGKCWLVVYQHPVAKWLKENKI
jgi:hypothetical protein